MSGATPFVPKPGSINLDVPLAEMTALNSEVLALVGRGSNLLAQLDAVLTTENRTAELLLASQRETASPFSPGGGQLAPITDEQWTYLQKRTAMLRKLVDLLTKPIGNASSSVADQLRQSSNPWLIR